jgi:NADPH-dependent F420 reductase
MVGLALATRLHHAGHEVVIASRDATKAATAAATIGPKVVGTSSEDAAAKCEILFLAIPYSGHRALLEPLKDALRGKIVIDTTVPIDPSDLLRIKTESGASAAEEAAATISDAFVYAAFQTISHRVLRQAGVEHDVLVAGPEDRKSSVIDIVRSMNLRPIDAGPLRVAGHIERVTVLLLSINKANKVKESGIKITGI